MPVLPAPSSLVPSDRARPLLSAPPAIGGLEGYAAAGTTDGDGGRAAGGVVRWQHAAWIRQPSHAQFRDYYPRAAFARETPGRVRLSCHIRYYGVPYDCQVLSEAPTG